MRRDGIFQTAVFLRQIFRIFAVVMVFCYQNCSDQPTVRKNCPSDQQRNLQKKFLTLGQNNFGNKIPFLHRVNRSKFGPIVFKTVFNLDAASVLLHPKLIVSISISFA